MGRFGKLLGTFWFWDILTGYPHGPAKIRHVATKHARGSRA